MENIIYNEARKIKQQIHFAKGDLDTLKKNRSIEIGGVPIQGYGVEDQVLQIIEDAINKRICELEQQFNEI